VVRDAGCKHTHCASHHPGLAASGAQEPVMVLSANAPSHERPGVDDCTHRHGWDFGLEGQ